MTKLGLNKENINVVENWVDNEEIENIEVLKKNSDIVYAGRFMKHKNVDTIVRSIFILKNQFPDIRAVLIGEGPEKEKIKHLIKELNLEKAIELKDFMLKEKVYQFMKSSKVFILPSVIEGFGIIVIEANACGLPVITVRHKRNASADLINDYQNGFVCKLSPDEIAEKTAILLENENLRKKMSLTSIEKSKNYDIDFFTRKIENIYKNAN